MNARARLDLGGIPKIVLDTSVLFAYFGDEPGALDIEKAKGKALLPFMAICELHYVATRKQSRAFADRCFGLIKSWDVPILHSTEELILAASRLKDKYGLGIADSFIAGASVCERVPLLTYDSDFLPLVKELVILGVA